MYIRLREHRLWNKGMDALRADGLRIYGSPLPALHKDTFHALAEWDAFTTTVMTEPTAPAAQRWVRHRDKRMRVQTAQRASLPPHCGNGAVEAPLADVRQMLRRRKWAFRNEARMNLLRELVRLRINRHDDTTK